MREEYDFKNVKNPYAKKIKKQITINIDSEIIDYFAESQPIELKTEVYRNILPLSNMLLKPSSP